jgi:hypothetical protein
MAGIVDTLQVVEMEGFENTMRAAEQEGFEYSIGAVDLPAAAEPQVTAVHSACRTGWYHYFGHHNWDNS